MARKRPIRKFLATVASPARPAAATGRGRAEVPGGRGLARGRGAGDGSAVIEASRRRAGHEAFDRDRGDAPAVEVVLLDQPDLPSAGAGETPIIALAPAIANAIFDATGVRLRDLPLIPGRRLPE